VAVNRRVAALEQARGIVPPVPSPVVFVARQEHVPSDDSERARWLAGIRRSRGLAPQQAVFIMPDNGRG
jgi:hypothetical protein